MQPKISIVVPVYNVENYLDRCMDSLLHQTLKDIEIILVNDGSPDNSPAMCDEYARRDARVKVVHKENAGLGMARNSGLEIATGEYVAFVDSDDFVDLNMYELLFDEAKIKQLDILFCGFYTYKDNAIVKACSEVSVYTQYSGQECQDVLLGMINNCGDKRYIVKYEMSVWHSIYKLDLIRQNNIQFCSEREFFSEDIIFHTDVIVKCSTIGFIPNKLYYYCYNESSLTKIYRDDRIKRHEILFHELKRRIQEHQYMFDLRALNHLYLLKVRYDITIIASFDFKAEKAKKYISKIIGENSVKTLIKKIPWKEIPLRYVLFFLLVKFRMVNILYYIIKK